MRLLAPSPPVARQASTVSFCTGAVLFLDLQVPLRAFRECFGCQLALHLPAFFAICAARRGYVDCCTGSCCFSVAVRCSLVRSASWPRLLGVVVCRVGLVGLLTYSGCPQAAGLFFTQAWLGTFSSFSPRTCALLSQQNHIYDNIYTYSCIGYLGRCFKNVCCSIFFKKSCERCVSLPRLSKS